MTLAHTDPWLVCHTCPSDTDHWTPAAVGLPGPPQPPPAPAVQPARESELRQRLHNANAYFRRKAAEVLTDDNAIRLMAVLYQEAVIDPEYFHDGESGVALAKLAAAGFCEIGVTAVWITDAGHHFTASLANFTPAADSAHRQTGPERPGDMLC